MWLLQKPQNQMWCAHTTLVHARKTNLGLKSPENGMCVLWTFCLLLHNIIILARWLAGVSEWVATFIHCKFTSWIATYLLADSGKDYAWQFRLCICLQILELKLTLCANLTVHSVLTTEYFRRQLWGYEVRKERALTWQARLYWQARLCWQMCALGRLVCPQTAKWMASIIGDSQAPRPQ